MGEGFRVRDQRGQSLVEFSLSAMLLALLLLGIIQYGFLFAAYTTVRNASAVGARQALINTNTAAATAKAAVGPMLQTNIATANFGTTTVAGSTAYVVTVTYPLKLIIPFVVPGSTNGTRTLTATTIMR